MRKDKSREQIYEYGCNVGVFSAFLALIFLLPLGVLGIYSILGDLEISLFMMYAWLIIMDMLVLIKIIWDIKTK